MTKLKWLLFSIPLLAFGVMVYFFGSAIGSDPTLLPSTRIDHPFPAFSLQTLERPNQIKTEKDIKGPVLINVWATWCPSCQVEHPLLVELAQSGIPIIGMNYKDEPEAARKYLELHGNPFKWTISDVKGDLGLDLGVYGAPETYLIDAQGKIRHRFIGAITPESWRSDIWPVWQSIGGFQPAQAPATEQKGASS